MEAGQEKSLRKGLIRFSAIELLGLSEFISIAAGEAEGRL
jgi:hypothetical protein